MSQCINCIVLIAALTAQAGCSASSDQLTPLKDSQRVFSTTGFSFLPPQGPGWLERFEKNQITFLKQADPSQVSFFLGAVEGPLESPFATKDDLMAFVRSKKELHADSRHSDVSNLIEHETDHPCVRYETLARDHQAKNRGPNDYLLMKTVGRFCVHPQNDKAAVDIYYSVRHIPTFDPAEMIAEAATFLNGLRFEKAP